MLKDLGSTCPQYLVMLVLWEHGELPVKKLGEHLQLDSGTLSPLLMRLEAVGLVRRERTARDERCVHVYLTDDGAGLRRRALLVPRRINAATGFELEEITDLTLASTGSPGCWARRCSRRHRAAAPPSAGFLTEHMPHAGMVLESGGWTHCCVRRDR